MKHDTSLIAGLDLKDGRALLRHFDRYALDLDALRDYIDTMQWHSAIEFAYKAGHIGRELRNALRKHQFDRAEMSARWNLAYKPCSTRKVRALWRDLIAEGLIAPLTKEAEDRHINGTHKLTDKAERLRAMRLTSRVNRAKVDKVIADVIDRAKEINTYNQLPYYVGQIALYGSALQHDAGDYGDVDLWVNFQPRDSGWDQDAFFSRVAAVTKAAGQRYTGRIIEDIPKFWLERQLKKRLRVSSIISMDGLHEAPAAKGWLHKIIFRDVKPLPMVATLGTLPSWLVIPGRFSRS